MTTSYSNPSSAKAPTGRGFGGFIEGDCITSPRQVKVGDLLTEYNIQFNSCNLLRVTQTEWSDEPLSLKGSKFYAVIVAQNETSRPGFGTTSDICFWHWQIGSAEEKLGGEKRQAADTIRSVLHRSIVAQLVS